MDHVLNSIIKFDLHIHSYASKYKEADDIVDRSTKEHLPVLFNKLNEYSVTLFSITDHNRFDYDLYCEIDRILIEDCSKYENVKNVLAGVEFDVVIDEGMKKCHIIAIFDAANKAENYKKISIALDKDPLNNKEAHYSRKKFEDVLRDIGLNTILIASQTKGIGHKRGGKNSLSDSTKNVEEILQVGYINALEFQKPAVEGMLLNSLKEFSTPTSLFSGSDCHDWEVYPHHDKNNRLEGFRHSEAKMLPTFKGLLMSITSPETRFDCLENDSPSKINYVSSNNYKIPLVNGLNAVIGENGSGKSTILSLIGDKTNDEYVKQLIADNQLDVDGQVSSHRIKFISQGQIVENYFRSGLFSSGEDSVYSEVDHSKFLNTYNQYFEDLTSIIESAIAKQEAIDNLHNFSVQFEAGMDGQTYYIQIENNINTNSSVNVHRSKLNKVKDVYDGVMNLKSDRYFSEHTIKIDEILNGLASIHNRIRSDYLEVEHKEIVKNSIRGCVSKYTIDIQNKSSAADKSRQNYNKKVNNFKQAVVNAICSTKKDMKLLDEPNVCDGKSTRRKNGFNFYRKAKYSDTNVVDYFYNTLFVQKYASKEKLSLITSKAEYTKAVRDCTNAEDIKIKLDAKLNNFFKDMKLCDEFITDIKDTKVGNTLGEQSLTYYKYFTQEKQDWDVLIVDQPEDNISNNNISNELIKYFNAIRNEKQIIFATHNPLLVVNMDVDNVIFMKNDNGILSAISGCLEYEDEDYSLLDIVADNMDGGKESIEKRLKVYG